jgi:hypothetical protein
MFRQLLERIAAGLEQQGIPYMVIGGQAMLLYGEPRLTKDIDITLGVGPDRLAEVLGLVARFGWKTLAESPAKFVKETMVLPCLYISFSILSCPVCCVSHARPYFVNIDLGRFLP